MSMWVWGVCEYESMGVWEYGSVGVWEYGSVGVSDRDPLSSPISSNRPFSLRVDENGDEMG